MRKNGHFEDSLFLHIYVNNNVEKSWGYFFAG